LPLPTQSDQQPRDTVASIAHTNRHHDQAMRRPRSSLDALPPNQKRLVAVEFCDGSLVNLLTRRIPGYLDNPLRQNMWRAGHAPPGVWLVLGLVDMLYVDQTPLSDGLKSLVRVTLLVAPILVSLGFFLSVLSPKAERPNGLINLIYLAALLLAVGVVTLGIGLFQA
jgi:hypothetical protein